MKDGIIYNKADLIIDTQMTGGGGDKRDYASPFMYTSHPNRHGDPRGIKVLTPLHI